MESRARFARQQSPKYPFEWLLGQNILHVESTFLSKTRFCATTVHRPNSFLSDVFFAERSSNVSQLMIEVPLFAVTVDEIVYDLVRHRVDSGFQVRQTNTCRVGTVGCSQ